MLTLMRALLLAIFCLLPNFAWAQAPFSKESPFTNDVEDTYLGSDTTAQAENLFWRAGHFPRPVRERIWLTDLDAKTTAFKTFEFPTETVRNPPNDEGFNCIAATASVASGDSFYVLSLAGWNTHLCQDLRGYLVRYRKVGGEITREVISTRENWYSPMPSNLIGWQIQDTPGWGEPGPSNGLGIILKGESIFRFVRTPQELGYAKITPGSPEEFFPFPASFYGEVSAEVLDGDFIRFVLRKKGQNYLASINTLTGEYSNLQRSFTPSNVSMVDDSERYNPIAKIWIDASGLINYNAYVSRWFLLDSDWKSCHVRIHRNGPTINCGTFYSDSGQKKGSYGTKLSKFWRGYGGEPELFFPGISYSGGAYWSPTGSQLGMWRFSPTWIVYKDIVPFTWVKGWVSDKFKRSIFPEEKSTSETAQITYTVANFVEQPFPKILMSTRKRSRGVRLQLTISRNSIEPKGGLGQAFIPSAVFTGPSLKAAKARAWGPIALLTRGNVVTGARDFDVPSKYKNQSMWVCSDCDPRDPISVNAPKLVAVKN